MRSLLSTFREDWGEKNVTCEAMKKILLALGSLLLTCSTISPVFAQGAITGANMRFIDDVDYLLRLLGENPPLDPYPNTNHPYADRYSNSLASVWLIAGGIVCPALRAGADTYEGLVFSYSHDDAGVRFSYAITTSAVYNYCPEFISQIPVNLRPVSNGYSRPQLPIAPAAPRATAPSQPFARGVLVTNTDTVINVRVSPSTDAPISSQAHPGDRVTIWEQREVGNVIWYKIAIYGSNAVGWVRGELVEATESSESGSSE